MSTEKLWAFPGCTRRHDDIELQVPNPEHEAVATISLCWHCADQMEEALHEKLAEWFKNLGLDILARIPHLAQTSDAVNRQLSCFSSRYMNLLAVFQI